jgi:hypothetical protein
MDWLRCSLDHALLVGRVLLLLLVTTARVVTMTMRGPMLSVSLATIGFEVLAPARAAVIE